MGERRWEHEGCYFDEDGNLCIDRASEAKGLDEWNEIYAEELPAYAAHLASVADALRAERDATLEQAVEWRNERNAQMMLVAEAAVEIARLKAELSEKQKYVLKPPRHRSGS